jgi:hypothetical protein
MAVVEALRTEQQRRARMRHQEIGDSREILYRKLDQMRERRFGPGAPPRPLSAAEMADLEEFLRGFAARTMQN